MAGEPVSGEILECRAIEPGTRAYDNSIELRYQVMYEPFGLPREVAEGTIAPGALHLGAFHAERLIGYGRLVSTEPPGAEMRVYQLAVEPEWQGRGVGTRLVAKMVREARRCGTSRLTLDARLPAISFYERLGFQVSGEEFLMPRTQMPHRPMRLDLTLWRGPDADESEER